MFINFLKSELELDSAPSPARTGRHGKTDSRGVRGRGVSRHGTRERAAHDLPLRLRPRTVSANPGRNRLPVRPARARLLPDAEPLPPGRGDSARQSQSRLRLAAGHLHGPIQSPASSQRPSVPKGGSRRSWSMPSRTAEHWCATCTSTPKEADEELRWTERQGTRRVQEAVKGLVNQESDTDVRMWARVRLGLRFARLELDSVPSNA